MADTGPPPPPDSNSVQSSAATESSNTNGPRLWEKPWTFDEMRIGANNWSLAGDAGLLLYLQEFSQRMISRVHEIEKEVDGLLHDSKLTDVRVHNVFNDFIMLADTQFVENRVYDEDVSQENSGKPEVEAEVKEKTREEKEAELIPRVKEALELGIHVIDQAYEQLDSHVADSDSEEEETGYRVDPLLEAKDPYLNRPLPKMIGTPTFMEDDNVGLIEEESDGEETDIGSVSESDEEEEEDEKKVPLEDSSDEYSSSDEDDFETEKKSKPSKTVVDDSDSESDGSLFGDVKKKEKPSENSEESSEEDEEEEEEEEKPKKSAGPIDFAAELAAKLGGPQKKQHSESEDEDAEKVETIETEGKKKKHKKDRKHKDSVSKKSEKGKKEKVKQQEDEPFPQEEEDDPFGVNKGGMFSSGRGLFDDDDDDEGDMFNEPDDVKPKAVKEEKSKKNKTDKDVDVKVTKPSSGGLFSDEDEDDLFASVSSTTKQRKSSNPKEKSDLFADDNDDKESSLFSSEAPPAEPSKPQKKTKDKKMPAGAVSMFGGASNPLAAAIKKRNKVESDEDEKELSEDEKSRSSSVRSNQSATSINTKQRIMNKASPSPSSNSLFDDDGDDDALFSSPAKPRSNSKPKPKETKSLFDDEEEGDLFGIGSKPQNTQKKETGKSKSGSLFGAEDDGEEDAMFGQPTKSTDSKKPPGGVSLFGGVDVLNKQKDKPAAKEPEPVKAKAPVSKKISLFDEDEEEDDLFNTGAVKSDVPKPTSQAKPMSKAKGLFDDDDVLFGGAEEESPDVDIFGGAPAAKSEQTVDKAKGTTKSQPPLGGPNLLDEDDDDDDGDLFSSKSKTTIKPTESIKVEGATTTESSDQPIEELPEEVKPKKPVGGVSMFGGIDPIAALKKNKPVAPKEEVKESPPAVAKTTPSPTPAVNKPTKVPAKQITKDSLFGEEDDDEDDDLFGSKKPTAAKTTPKAPAKSDSLFGSPSSPPSDIFGSSPTPKSDILSESPAQTKPDKKPDKSRSIFESEESNDDDMFSTATTKKKDKVEEETTEAPPVSKAPKKPPGAVPMFGGVDLFAGIKKEKPMVSEPAESDDHSSEDKKPVKKPDINSSIFETEESNDDDMFSTKKKDKIEEETTEAPPVLKSPKKPPGTVSMFGGVDPFADIKKEKPIVSEPAASDELPNEDMNLAINPAALLPGAAPPSKEPENVAVGFDEPAKVTTLDSANKSRARIQAKRRPPSRHIRQSVSPSENKSDILSNTANEDVVTSELPSFNDRVPQPTSDLFGNDDLLGESTSASPPLISKTSIPEEKQTDKFADDLFSTSKKKTPIMSDEDLFGGPVSATPKSKSVLTSESDDDIFSPSLRSKPRKTDDMFSPNSKSKSTESSDDIFNPSSKSKASNKTSAMVNGVGDDIFSSSKPKSVIKEEEDEDIFSTKSKTKKPTDFERILDSTVSDSKEEKKSDNIDSQMTKKTETVEDDIFADSSLFKKKENKVTTEKDEAKTTVETNTTKANDEDATPVTKTKARKTKAKAKTKDEDLFQDETDIFADVPAAKPKEKKKKKAAVEKKSIFKDDTDDIFSTDSKATKTKTKKDKKKTTETEKGKSKASTDVVDIFDDPLS